MHLIVIHRLRIKFWKGVSVMEERYVESFQRRELELQ